MTAAQGEVQWFLRVTDLKQFVYCPRVVYYT
jgi:CRISPR/Cas system-associated exonuclease Cas4 (RecB family)